MKAMVTRMLAACRLAPAGQVHRLEAEALETSRRSRVLEERLTSTRAELERWKQRCEERSSAASTWKQTAGELEAKARTDSARLKATCDELKGRAATLAVQVSDFQARLEQADRAAEATRQELKVMETKVDLLEAAIQVLDARTREGAVS